jgi:spore coat protein H
MLPLPTLLIQLLLACDGGGVVLPFDSAGDSGGPTDDSGEPADDSGEPTDDSAEPTACVVTATGEQHVEEGSPVTLTFACDGAVNPDDPLTVGLPDGAAWDAATWTFTWTPGLDQGGRYDLLATTPSGAAGTVTLWVSDNFASDENIAVDPALYQEEDGLPVLHLTFDPNLNSGSDTPATLVFMGRTYNVEAQTRGASSLSYPQQSFTIKFAKEDRLDADELGWDDFDDLVLQTTFDDVAGIRNTLSHRVWGSLDPARLTPQTAMGVVYVKGRFHGLYQLIERVDDDFYNARGLAEDGNLYKSVNHDANFYSTNSWGGAKYTWHDGYEKREGSPTESEPGAFDDIDALVEWAATSPNSVFREELADWMLTEEVQDWFFFVSFGMVTDSAGKNAHLYHDPITDGPFRITPWDYNASWGQEWETSRISVTYLTDFVYANRLFEAMLNDDVMSAEVWARYEEQLNGPLSEEALLAEAQALLDASQWARTRNWRRWGGRYKSYFGHGANPDDEAEYLLTWIDDRHEIIADWVARGGL